MMVILLCTLTFVLSVEFVIGILGNMLMALVILKHWVKRRKISVVDQILTALAVSRVALLWSLIISLLFYMLKPALVMTGKRKRIMNISWTVSNHSSIWLATSLSLLYFFKIATFSNSVFLYLKWRVNKVVSVTLLVSLVLLLINIMVINIYIDAWIDGYRANTSNMSSSNTCAHFSKLIVFTNSMFTFIPFTVSLALFLLLIFSLWRHLKNMQLDSSERRDASTMAHIRALQTVVAFLLLYAIFFLSLILQYRSINFEEKKPIVLFFWATGAAFPAGHSCILILGNSKLRQTSLSVLYWPRCKKSTDGASSDP